MGERSSETEDSSMGLQSLLLTGRSCLSVLWTDAGLSRAPPSVAEVGDVFGQTRVKPAVSVREALIPWSSFAPLAELHLFWFGAPDEMTVSSVGRLISLLVGG